jgi:hypothetical protein
MKVISLFMEGFLSRALIRDVCHSCDSGLPLAQRHIKRGHENQRSRYSHSAPTDPRH